MLPPLFHPVPRFALLGALLWLAALAVPADAQLFERSTVVENVRIRVSDREVIEGARIVIRGDRIAAIGSGVEKPFLARTIDGAGGTVTAGFVAVQSGLALDRSRGGGALSRAGDGFDHFDRDAILEALAGGVTTVCLVPAGRPGILGTAAVVRLAPREGGGFGEIVREDAALCLDLSSGATPLARLRAYQGIRKLFEEASEHRSATLLYEEELAEYAAALAKKAEAAAPDAKPDAEGGAKDATPEKGAAPAGRRELVPGTPSEGEHQATADEPPAGGAPAAPPAAPKEGEKKDEGPKKPVPPPRRPDLEVILRAIDRELPVRIDARRSSEILNALELGHAHDLELQIAGASEAHLVLPALAASEATLIIEPATGGEGAEADAERRRPADLAARLERAGIRWLLAPGPAVRELWWEASRAGAISGRDATGLVTTGAARFLALEGNRGSLAAGARADLVLWSADPATDPAARVRQVIIGGERAYAAPGEAVPAGAPEPPAPAPPAGKRERL